MRRMRAGVIGIVLGLFLLGLSRAQADETLIAVAANFTGTAHELIQRFETQTGHTVKASFGSTGKLYAQIENGAPFDVFLAADAARPEMTEQTELAVAGSRFTYARGKLALWSPKALLFDDPNTYLTQAAFRHLAIANPRTAPYGLAAQQILTRLGVWHELQGKLVQGDSIAQTFQFIATGNVDAGFVALSQLHDWKDDQGANQGTNQGTNQDTSQGTTWIVPDAYYEALNQQAVLLKRGQSNPAATAWLNFLQSPEAVAIIEGYGYGVDAQQP